MASSQAILWMDMDASFVSAASQAPRVSSETRGVSGEGRTGDSNTDRPLPPEGWMGRHTAAEVRDSILRSLSCHEAGNWSSRR
jgi:hypothetical protein